jgi:BirA family transcriptional regulator, biotin operon repressor / biotin---[acetyl-CoA-carboxylase] ligase
MNKTNKRFRDAIRQIILEEETQLRLKTFDPETVDKISRFGAIIGNTIEHHDQLDRGMDRARQLISRAEETGRSFSSGTVILADEMAQSRGRFKRSWYAPKGGLWLTLIMVNTLLPENSLLLPMAAGVACCEVLRTYNIPAHVKWVNDVLVDRGKIAGILSETFNGVRSGEEYVLIGIGMNVNNSEFPEELTKQATSVKSYLKRECSLFDFTVRLLAKLCWNIGLLYYEEAKHLDIHGGIGRNSEILSENIAPRNHLLLESYKSLTDIFNRKVLYGFNVQDAPQFEAKVIGLDSSGGLLLELEDNSRIIQHSGEIVYLD